MQRDDPPDGAHEQQGGSLPAQLGERVESIVRAAKEEAAAVQRHLAAQRREAEEEAQRYLLEARRQADRLAEERARRLRELTDDLIGRAEAIRDQVEELSVALERATRALEQEGLGAEPAPDAGGSGRDLGVEDLRAARLAAIELAVAGRSREEVDDHLRRSLGMGDTRRLLDDVFAEPGAARTRS
jgi:hypothetical protein